MSTKVPRHHRQSFRASFRSAVPSFGGSLERVGHIAVDRGGCRRGSLDTTREERTWLNSRQRLQPTAINRATKRDASRRKTTIRNRRADLRTARKRKPATASPQAPAVNQKRRMARQSRPTVRAMARQSHRTSPRVPGQLIRAASRADAWSPISAPTIGDRIRGR